MRARAIRAGAVLVVAVAVAVAVAAPARAADVNVVGFEAVTAYLEHTNDGCLFHAISVGAISWQPLQGVGAGGGTAVVDVLSNAWYDVCTG